MKISQKSSLMETSRKTGYDPKTIRKYKRSKGVIEKHKQLHVTRSNPFEKHWPEIVQMLEKAPELYATTILEHLIKSYPGEYSQRNLRSLHRHLQRYRAEHGKDKPVIFRQVLKPGRQSQSDWTDMGSLKITIGGKPFKHLLFHFMLPYSRFETVMICKTESYDTLSRGFELAVSELGGVAAEHRTDNLTAATQKMGSGRVFTQRWSEFLAHYDVQPSRNNPGVSHENGSVEKSHHTFKMAVDQHLMLRQSRDFKTEEDYAVFLDDIKKRRNLARRERITEELKNLKTLPGKSFNEVALFNVHVTTCSTIQVLSVTYSVPSRLIGLWLKAVVRRNTIELMFGSKVLLTLPRLEAGVLIDYRHVIDSLLRKPGAFSSYQYRAHLFPDLAFRQAYDTFQKKGLTSCSKSYLELLHTAKMYGEREVSFILIVLMQSGVLPTKEAVLSHLAQHKPIKPVKVEQPDLAAYNKLHSHLEEVTK